MSPVLAEIAWIGARQPSLESIDHEYSPCLDAYYSRNIGAVNQFVHYVQLRIMTPGERKLHCILLAGEPPFVTVPAVVVVTPASLTIHLAPLDHLIHLFKATLEHWSKHHMLWLWWFV